jgi:hypothetical protein
MTEAVILALMTLIGAIMLLLAFVIIVCMSLQKNPSWFKLWTDFGHFEMHFNNNVDKSDE